MPFYKCKIVTSTYSVNEKILYSQSENELLQKNQDIIDYQEYKVRINFKDFSLQLFRIMQRLISNSYNTVQALTIAENCFSGIQRSIIQTIVHDIYHGTPFSEALRQFPQCFEITIIEILKVSELTGRLAESISNIIKYIEYQNTFNTKIKNAMRYPIFVLILIFFISVIWIVWIIPQFGQIFTDLELAVPTITNWMLSLSNAIRNHYIISSIVPFAIFITCKQLHFKIPIISKFTDEINKLQFFDTMALMLRERIHLIDTIKCVTSRQEFERYAGLVDLITSGYSFSSASDELKLFSKEELAIISVSEQTGQYWVAFNTFADMMRLRIDDYLNLITKRLPSILICVVGVILIAFVYGTFMPLYSSIDLVTS